MVCLFRGENFINIEAHIQSYRRRNSERKFLKSSVSTDPYLIPESTSKSDSSSPQQSWNLFARVGEKLHGEWKSIQEGVSSKVDFSIYSITQRFSEVLAYLGKLALQTGYCQAVYKESKIDFIE